MVRLIALAAVFLALLQTPLARADGARVVVVLDGSGSMWGQVEGRPKIDIAKDVMTKLLDGWDPKNHLGLVAYGHRRKGDCADIETVLPVGTFDRPRAASALAAIKPKGKTPLTDAVRRAGAMLRAGEDPGSVVLITDGLETCKGDPCALGRELGQAGLNLKVHVVGFDLKGQNVEPLQCLAKETGGRYLNAESAGGLDAALGDVVNEATAPRNVTIRALDKDGGQITDPVHWTVTVIGDGGAGGGQAGLSYNPVYRLGLPKGDYLLTGQYGEVRVARPFTVPEGEEVALDVSFATVTVKLTATLSQGGAPYNKKVLDWRVFETLDGGKRGGLIAKEAGKSVSFGLLPGSYLLAISAVDLRLEQALDIDHGMSRDVAVNLNAGLLSIEGRSATDQALKGHVDWRLFATAGGKAVAREVRRKTTFLVPAGDYVLTGRYKGNEVEIPVSLAPGEEKNLTAAF